MIRGFTQATPGSVLIRTGNTHVFCTATIEVGVPAWRESSGKGWVTAEYEMLPGSTGERRKRTRMRVDGRTQEIQRLIGRSLRAVVDMTKLGPHTIYLDCDVLQADGGTRTTAINGAYVALVDAVAAGVQRGLWGEGVIVEAVAATSVGIVDGVALLDLDYSEDVKAEVDCNLVQTQSGKWVEIQATAEGEAFDDAQFDQLKTLGRHGLQQIFGQFEELLGQGSGAR